MLGQAGAVHGLSILKRPLQGPAWSIAGLCEARMKCSGPRAWLCRWVNGVERKVDFHQDPVAADFDASSSLTPTHLHQVHR